MRILDMRGKDAAYISSFEKRYNKPEFYREMGSRTSHFTTDADIEEFQKQAEKEGAEAIFIHSRTLVAYIPIDNAPAVPQTIPALVDDLLQYYKVPPSAF